MKKEMTNLQNKMTDPDVRTDTEQHNIKLISKYQKELDSLEEQGLQPNAGLQIK
jgi:hypothetical protein